MTTPFEKYQEAIQFLSNAVDEFDQFRSCLKDCGLSGVQIPGIHRRSDSDLFRDLESMLRVMKELTCDDCGQAIAAHDDDTCAYQTWHDIPAEDR